MLETKGIFVSISREKFMQSLKHRGLLGGLAFLGVLPLAGAAFAQAAPEAKPASTLKNDIVIVTGTREAGVTASDSAAPVTVLGDEVLTRVGQPDLVQALAQNVPSFNAQAFGGDTANLTLSAKLRGLSPNHALVLINGKRRHGTANLAVLGGAFQGGAAPDLNFITLPSVDHIEVLLDGAAAQYGSDALAGVINIIEKKDSKGGQLQLSGGEYFDGGGTTGDISVNFGLAPTPNSFLNITAESKYHGFSFRGDVDPRVLNTAYNTGSSSKLANYPGIVNAPDYPYLNRISGDAEYRLYNLGYNWGYNASEDLKFYSFGTVGHKFGQAYENYRVPNRIVGKNGVRPAPLGFSPKEATDETDSALTIGATGKLAGWKWDLSTTYGRDAHIISVINSFNASLYVDTSTTTTNGFSPRDFHAGDFIGSEWTTNLDLSREFNLGLAEPVTVAVGAEYRDNTYEIKAGDDASRYKEGSQSYPGFSLTDAGSHDRNNYAFYADVAGKPIKPLQLDAAVRYESYSDFGEKTVGKLTGRYDFSPAIAIRATASTGFRAPTLAEEFYSATNVSPTSAFVQLPPNSPAAKLIGVNGLKPEKSTNLSGGLVAHPTNKLTFTVDAYQIEIKDRIVGSGTLFGTGGALNSAAVLAAIQANGNVLDSTVSQTGVNIFTNGLDTRTKGVDIVATYPLHFATMGDLDLSLTGNYTDTKVTKIAANPVQLTGQTLFDKTTISFLETAAPKYRVVATGIWFFGDLSVTLKEAYYGESSNLTSRTGAVYYKNTISAKFITDIDISYKLPYGVKASIGANNLFNQYPDQLNSAYRADLFQANSNGYVTKYPTFSPFGINGGYYYGKLAYSF